MRHRPHLTDSFLVEQLASRFALDVTGLVFLPLGEDGWVYRVEARDGRCWLVKLNQQSPETHLALTAYLCTAVGLDWIPAPRPALDGSLWTPCDGLYLSLQAFVEGDILMERPIRPAQAECVGGMLAQLHRAGAALPAALRARLPQETYVRHQDVAARVLAVATSGAAEDGVQGELSRFIRGRQAQIDQVLTRARALGEQIHWRDPSFVLCHGDIHAANVIADPAGKLWVIDWDGVLFAPPERDLMFWWGGPHWPAVAAGYGLEGQPDAGLMRYYGLEWAVQEIADYGENVYFLPLSAAQKQDSLAEFVALFEPGNALSLALAP